VSFDVCLNPLHRLHRVLRDTDRALDEVLPGACVLTDKVLELVHQAYPQFVHRLSVKLAEA
jgi:hypothetical protein